MQHRNVLGNQTPGPFGGSRDPLAVELGAQENHPPQIINSPSHEEEPDEDDKEAPVKPVTPDKQG